MFQRAERKKAKLRLALCAPSGGGKTYSALLLAMGLGGKIAMIDTENGSGELYSGLCEYDVERITAPYTPKKYVAAIKEAEKAGYKVLIIDGLSHAWSGEGGILDMKDAATKASRSGNSYMAWRTITPEHNNLIEAMLTSSIHIIATMRTKTAYEIVEEDGKKKPVKLGLAPVQRDGMEYEFTVVLDLSVDGHIATSSKDRTGLFDGQFMKPSAETGKMLLDWLESGVEPPQVLTLEAFIEKVEDVKALKHLGNIWNKYWPEIKGWNEEDRQIATDIKDKRKKALSVPEVANV